MGRAQDLDSLVKERGWEIGAELGVADAPTLLYLLENNPTLYMFGVDAYDFSYGKGDKHSTGFKQYDLIEQTKLREFVEASLDKYKLQVTLVVLPTTIAAEDFGEDTLDFVFIDADHREAFARADIAAWLPKVKETGYLTGHDWKFPSVRKALNGMLPGWKTRGSVWYIPKSDVKFR
jgi:hypothetical protein